MGPAEVPSLTICVSLDKSHKHSGSSFLHLTVWRYFARWYLTGVTSAAELFFLNTLLYWLFLILFSLLIRPLKFPIQYPLRFEPREEENKDNIYFLTAMKNEKIEKYTRRLSQKEKTTVLKKYKKPGIQFKQWHIMIVFCIKYNNCNILKYYWFERWELAINVSRLGKKHA